MSANTKEPINPFYVLAGICGVVFTLTACAFGILMVRANRGGTAEESHGLLDLLDRHGMAILGVEVLLLAVFSVAAIWLDHVRGKRIRAKEKSGENDHSTQ